MIERRRVPRRLSPIGTGGAIVIAASFILVLGVAIAAGVLAIRQLGEGAGESRRLFDIEERLDSLTSAQFAAETALRGFLITRDREFLEPALSSDDPFERLSNDLAARLEAADVHEARPFLDRMTAYHRAWLTQVAQPLMRDPSQHQMASRESYGKMVTDQLRGQGDALRRIVNEKYDASEASLAAKIDTTVECAIAVVVIFAFAGFYLAFVQRNTAVELERQLSIAASLQAALGVGWMPIPGTTIGTAYVSATSESEVGGDLFDAWVLGPRHGAILIADMSGKGIDAVVNTAFCKYSIRALLDANDDPAAVMTEFNQLFTRTVSDPSMFAVMFLGIVDAETGSLQYVSAGHEPAFLRRGGEVRRLEIGGPIVGMLPDSGYEATTIALEPGDVIVLATDGLTESRDGSNEQLGEEAARGLIAEAPAEPQAMCDVLIATVRERGGGKIADDLALLAVRYDGGHRPAVAESEPG